MPDFDGIFRGIDDFGRGLTKDSFDFQYLKNEGWSIIATNPCCINTVSPSSVFGLSDMDNTVKALHTACEAASKLMFLYANYAPIQGVSQNSMYNSLLIGSAAQKVEGALTAETGFLFTKSFKNGKNKIHLDPASFVFTEPAFFSVTKNERFFSRTYASVILPQAPAAPTLTANSTGGTLVASSVYNICITYVFQDGFESLTSGFTAATTPGSGTSSISVTAPTAVPGAIGYRIYMTARNDSSGGIYSMLPMNALIPFGVNSVISYEANSSAQRFVRQGGVSYKPAGGGLSGGSVFEGLGTGEGRLQGDHTYTGFRSAGQSAANSAYWPSVILGKAKKAVKSVGLIGDSVQAGTGDHGYAGINGGFGVRALTNQLLPLFSLVENPIYPYVKVALGGEKASQFANQFNTNQYSRIRLAITELATNVISNYGTNDLSDSLSTIKANILLIAKWYTDRGIKFFQCTLFPRSSSTDGWKTTNNQTPEGGTPGSNRTAFNAWIRDSSESGFVAQCAAPGLVDFIDVCKYTEVNSSNVLTLGGGYWRVTNASPVLTGTFSSVTANYEFVDTSKTMTANQYKGYNIRITSGAQTGKTGCLSWNNTTTFNTNGTSIGGLPVAGDSYEIILLPCVDAIHPSSQGHIWGATAVQEALSLFI